MPNLRNLTQADVPFRDRSMNILNVGDWWGLILGAAVFMVIVALARPVYDVVIGTLRGVPVVGAAITPAATPEVQPGTGLNILK